MGRALRWLVTVLVGLAGLGLAWWLAQAVFRLAPDSATNIAAAFATLLAAPFAWWASRDIRLSPHVARPTAPALTEITPSGRGHVFVCYSRRADHVYVKRLAAFLIRAGVPVWFDQEIITGVRWEQVIQEKIDTCAAVVVVMTPEANASRWVAREIVYAEKTHKPILPLLLAGQEFFRLSDIQYEDVTGERMPSPAFLTRLRTLIPSPVLATSTQGPPPRSAEVETPASPALASATGPATSGASSKTGAQAGGAEREPTPPGVPGPGWW